MCLYQALQPVVGWSLLFVVLPLLLAAQNRVVQALPYTFTTISDSNAPDLIPLGQRKINDSGEVAFKSELGFASFVISKGSGGPLTQVASSSYWGLDVPGNGAIDNTGYVTFRGGITNDTVGIYRSNGSETAPIAIGDQDRSTAGTKTSFFEISVSESGSNIVWRQQTEVCSGSFMCGSSTSSYVARIDGNGTNIAQQGAGWLSIPTQAPVINDAGQVAFTAQSATNSKNHLARHDGSTLTTIDNDFTGGQGYWMNNAGDVVWAEVDAIRLFHNGGTTTIASTANGFSALMQPGLGQAFINDSGKIAFWGDVDQHNGNPVTWEGVYTGADVVNDRVIVHGDSVLGHTVGSVDLLGLNNVGKLLLAIQAASPDPWRALVVATPPSADYNQSGIIDAADYVVWRETGINGQQGYNLWRANYGNAAGSGAAAHEFANAVPEPQFVVLFILASAVGILRGSRRPQRSLTFHVSKPCSRLIFIVCRRFPHWNL